MNFGLLFRTVKYLRPMQVLYQVKYRLIKPAYESLELPIDDFKVQVSGLKTAPIPKYKCMEGDKFSFLNLGHEFTGWNFTENGMLWAYNQNYFDWINQEDVSVEECCKWIDRFVKDLPSNKVGLDPYPIALRSINWVKFFCRYPECATKERIDSLYSQLCLLEKKLEYHLLGNHLLEDAYALYIGGAFFNYAKLIKKAEKLLSSQLKEQILPDGAQYEQSPMYHCILLDRLLDCINIRKTNTLVRYAMQMLGHLECIVWKDGSIPMLNDSANGIAPSPSQLFDYAQRLEISWKPIPLKESGYRRMVSGKMEAIIDVGNITATYQPGHSHADTFSYELRIDGQPVVVDTGISTYNKTERRKYERGSIAHNCVVVDNKDSNEVYGGFRVGKRAKVSLQKDEDLVVVAQHNGYDKPCKRIFRLIDGKYDIEDLYDGDAISYLRLPEGCDVNRIKIIGATKIEKEVGRYSTRYNTFNNCIILKVHFSGHLKYSIK